MKDDRKPVNLRQRLSPTVKVSNQRVWVGSGAALLLAGVLFTLNSNTSPLEEVFFSFTTPTEMMVCDDFVTFTIEYVNGEGFPLTDQEITVTLPQGVSYVLNSLSDNSGYNVAEEDMSNLQEPIFSLDNLESGGSVSFSIKYRANVDGMNLMLAGSTPSNTVTLQANEGVATDDSESYNILYPSLSILSVNPTSQTITTGDTTTRSFNVTNGGYGRLSSFYVTDVYGSGIDLISTNVGTLNAGGDTIFLTGSDFTSIGNNDTYLDSYETISITETFVGQGCQNATISSVINSHWGCDGTIVNGTSTNAHITVNLKTPNISASATETLNNCFAAGSQSLQTITLNNTGQGAAFDLEVLIYKSSGDDYDEDIFSRIVENTITYQLGDNGSPIAITPTQTWSTKNTGDYSCLGANPVGKVKLDLPNLPAGEKYIIKFYTDHCCVDLCVPEITTGWKYDVNYDDACNQNPTSSTKTGQSPLDALLTVFTESPSDMRDGQIERFNYTVSSSTNEYPAGNGANYELEFELPAGLKWNGNADDIKWYSGLLTWTPTSTNYDSGSRTVSASFSLDAPFVLAKSEFYIKLEGDCDAPGASSGYQTMNLNVYYQADTSCASDCKMQILCNDSVSVNLHCPGNCAEGMSFNGFDIERISFGSPDNDLDGKADGSGSLDMDEVKTNRVMVGDTLKATFTGLVHTSGSHPSWDYGYAQSVIEDGSNLTAYQAEIKIYDASAGSYLTCNQVSFSSSLNGDDQTFSYDFSTSVLNSCAGFSGFSFGEGDSVWVYSYYRVSGNIGDAVREVEATNRYYLSDVANPTSESDKYECDTYGGKFTLIGYFFKNATKNNYTIKTCNKWVSQNFYMSIGDCCSNYSGGNLFPYEYRNWGHVKQAKVLIPENYEVLEIRLKQTRTEHTNSGKTQTVKNIQADSTSGDTLYFDLEQYYAPYGGSLLLSDDGFDGKLEIKLAPTCDVPNNTWQDLPWWFTFQPVSQLGGVETDWYEASDPDRVRFNPASLSLSSDAPTVDGLTHFVTWNLKVKNTSGSNGIENAWVHFKRPSGKVTIHHVIDNDSGDTLTLSGDIYEVGKIDKSKTRSLSVIASYTNCAPDYIEAYSGYECSGYPNTFAEFTCTYTQMELHVEPKSAELQMRVSGQSVGDECATKVLVTVEMASVQLAHADSVFMVVELPATQSILLDSGTTEFLYPLSGSFDTLSEPTIVSDTFRINTWDLDADLGRDGLPGILQTNFNRLQFRMTFDIESHFKPGEYIRVRSFSKTPCGTVLPQINLIYDPSIRFVRDLISGLDLDDRSTWGAAWGDYNNDGYEDLAVTEYAHWYASYLYHNNGDGTFTKVSAAPFTADKGSNVGVTWGDYDNDGDLDLFAANNVRAVNHLYQNNGNGSFTRVNGGEISSYGGYCHSASWVDYDNDGHIDLFVADFMPTKFNLLYHNNGDGTFSPATGNPIVEEAKWTMSGIWGDYDNDGLMDLYVCNARNANNTLYHNDGNGQFTRITSGDIVNDGGNSLGASWGDSDNDGDLDLYVTNASLQQNFYYVNDGDGTFTRNTSSLIATDEGHSFGSAWADVDNDGDLDLYVTNDNGNKNRLYINSGNHQFYVQEQMAPNEDEENSVAAAFADHDNDGDLDLFVANNNYKSNTLYSNNRGNCNSWKCFKLQGSNSNRSAIGARVKVKANVYGQNIWQMREVSGQTGGVSAQSTLRAYFGLGDATSIDSVIILWPSGYTQYITDVDLDDCEDIVEETGTQVICKAFIDENGNCVYDTVEQVIPNLMIEILPDARYVTTNNSGDISFYRGPGSYTLKQVDNGNWTHPCYNDVNIQIQSQEGGGGGAGLGGGGAPAPETCKLPNITGCPNPNMGISMSSTVLRKGFRNTYAISYRNDGSAPASNFEIAVEFNNDIIPLSADVPWTSTEAGAGSTTYVWNISNMDPYEDKTIIVIDSVSSNATVGTMLTTTGSFRQLPQDCDMSNNTQADINPVTGAIDPNDKLVFPEGNILSTDTLTYKIRFQNVGSALAQKVVIFDTLDKDLDPRTLQMAAHSHPYDMSLSEHGVLKFTFNYIMLPDSASNEPESHGFIQYRIAPYASSPNGTEIRNSAAIRFDYEDFLHTNVVENTISSKRDMPKVSLMRVVVSPNPIRDIGTFQIQHKEDPSFKVEIAAYEIFATNGQRVEVNEGVEQEIVPFNRGDLSPGVYIVRLRDKHGFAYSGKFVIQ